MGLKYFAMKIICAMVSLMSLSVSAEILELGESQVQGKKDQPEAMTLVSRAPLDVDGQAIKFSGKDKIREEVKNTKLFDLVYEK